MSTPSQPSGRLLYLPSYKHLVLLHLHRDLPDGLDMMQVAIFCGRLSVAHEVQNSVKLSWTV